MKGSEGTSLPTGVLSVTDRGREGVTKDRTWVYTTDHVDVGRVLVQCCLWCGGFTVLLVTDLRTTVPSRRSGWGSSVGGLKSTLLICNNSDFCDT